MIKYYKVMRGWGDDFISIEEKDLQRAIYAKIEGKVLIKGGLIDGSKIEMIVPDYHKTMGWNYSYKLEPEDYADINRKVGNMQNIIGIASDNIKFLKESNREYLIEKEDFILEEVKKRIEIQNPEIKKISSDIANKLKI